jgi:hypothetical protein
VLAVRLAAHTGRHVEGTVGIGAAALQPAVHETLLFLAGLAALAALVAAARGAPARDGERAPAALVALESAGV